MSTDDIAAMWEALAAESTAFHNSFLADVKRLDDSMLSDTTNETIELLNKLIREELGLGGHDDGTNTGAADSDPRPVP